MLKYGLIVSDFDGTLRRTEGGVSEGNARAVRDFLAAGGKFALCTGRMPSSILPYARELTPDGLAAAYQGAIVFDVGTGRRLRDVRIPNAEAVAVVRAFQENGRHVHVYDGDDFYVNKADEYLGFYERVCGVKGIVTPADIASEIGRRGICPHKILVMCAAEERDGIYAFAAEKFGKRFYVTTSTENLVELTMPGCDKGDALAAFADYYGIPVENTVAVGDNINDLPMIRRAGLGVAVANGDAALRAEAGFVTRSCDEDGVAYVIRKYGLGEEL